MSGFLRRRIIQLPFLLMGVYTVTFSLLRIVPGDPVSLLLGPQASAEDIARLREHLGLDAPFWHQYFLTLKNYVSLDFGNSISTHTPVWQSIADHLPATLELSIASTLLAAIIGVFLGVYSAAIKSQCFNRVCETISLFAVATPSFVLGPFLIFIFAFKLGWLPVSGRENLASLILPTLALSFAFSANVLRITRTAMLNVLSEGYIRTAHSKGLSPTQVYFRHALRNALVPIITVLGLHFGAILTGTITIETIFDWPGLGNLMYRALQQRDFTMIQGCALIMSILYLLVSVLTDVLYQIANPRMVVL